MLLSIAETTQRLGIGRSTLYKILGAGQLPVVRIHRRTLIPASSVDEFVARNTLSVRISRGNHS